MHPRKQRISLQVIGKECLSNHRYLRISKSLDILFNIWCLYMDKFYNTNMKVVVCKGNYDRLEIALSPIRSQWNNGHNKPWTTLIKAGKGDLIYFISIWVSFRHSWNFMHTCRLHVQPTKGGKKNFVRILYGNYVIVNHY